MTTDQRRYKNAPITEAVLEIRVQRDGQPKTSELKDLAESLKRDFPKQAPMRQVTVGLAAGDTQQPDSSFNQTFSQSQIGYRLANESGSRVLQLRSEGFAYSHLAPYSEWSQFRGEARPLWDRYRAVNSDAKLARCALRYINRIDVPGTKVELEDYFRLYPKIPETLPYRDIVTMGMSLQIPQEDLQCVAVVIQGLVEPARPSVVSIVLDIDIFRLGIQSWQDAELWEFMDKLRDRKNQIFEGCITDRTRELIDQ